jgi:hypothetical protein
MAPAVLRSGPYRFYFVSHDLHEPAHVHVDRDAYSVCQVLDQSCGAGLQSRLSTEGTAENRIDHIGAPTGANEGME